MKKLLLLVIFLLSATLRAQETNNNVIPQINVVVVLLINTNHLPIVLKSITNRFTNAKLYLPDPKIPILETQIRLQERRIMELTNGLPTSFVSNTDTKSTQSLTNLMIAWEEYDVAMSNITIKKIELKNLYNKTYAP